jgi:hypothetical protein
VRVTAGVAVVLVPGRVIVGVRVVVRVAVVLVVISHAEVIGA